MLIIGGATATGKSTLAIMIAKIADGEIVSADSMQIYKHLNIGTAKVTEEEKQNVTHHMINIIEPTQEFSVAQYQKLALPIIQDIANRGKLPIIVGGTGLYINSLIYPLQFGNSYKDQQLRESLFAQAKEFGNAYVHNKLAEIDSMAAKKIHPNNLKRVIRAIEVKTLSGKSISDTSEKKASINHRIYLINSKREALYEKINKRVDRMFVDGLLDELDTLINKYGVKFSNQSMQGIGYKEFYNYYRGYCSLNDVKELIKTNTRRYAKRQLTWFRGYNNHIMINKSTGKTDLELCNSILEDHSENLSNLE